MSTVLDKLLEKRVYWKNSGYEYGELIIDFVYMYENHLDIVFDYENPLVSSYKNLLGKLLNSNDEHLLVMVHCEAEKSFGGSRFENPLYSKLGDEAYYHYLQLGKKYPLECLDFHTWILYGLFSINEIEVFRNYFYVLLDTYKTNFDDDKYLMNHNKLYILYSFLRIYLPDFAADMFEKEKKNFVNALHDDMLLYLTSFVLASDKVNKEKNIEYLKESIEECERWKLQCKEERTDISMCLCMEKGIYHRNIGDYYSAVAEFKEVIDLTDVLKTQRYALAQIASIYYGMQCWTELNAAYEKYTYIFENDDIPDENIAILYSIKGVLRVHEGKNKEALNLANKAVDIAEHLVGKDGELMVLMRCNRALICWNAGDITSAQKENNELLDIIMENPQNYQEANTVVINNIQVTSIYEVINKRKTNTINRLAKTKMIPYDAITTYPIKSNYFYYKLITAEEMNSSEIDNLYDDLNSYYSNHINCIGYFEFIRGAVIKFNKDGDKKKEKWYLQAIIDYVNEYTCSIFAMEGVAQTIAKIKLIEYTGTHTMLESLVDKIWNKRIWKILQACCEKEHESEIEKLVVLSKEYMNIIISVCRYYKGFNDEYLYKYVLNYKYLLSIIDSNIEITRNGIININSIKFNKEYLAIDAIVYRYIDFGDSSYIAEQGGREWSDYNRELFFAVQCVGILLNKCTVKVLYDVKFCEYNDLFNFLLDEKVSDVEYTIVNKLKPFLTNKKRIYVSDPLIATRINYFLIRYDNDVFLSERYPVIFCSTILSIVDDISITDVKNAYIYGKYTFSDNMESNGNLKDYLPDIEYTQKEVCNIRNILECGRGSEKFEYTILEKADYEILHFSTHTIKSDDANMEMVIDEDYNQKRITIGYDDIVNADWNDVKLVVLSACNTGMMDEFGDEYMILSNAVVAAGAKVCMSTLYEVSDAGNALFMTCFYKRLKQTMKIIDAYLYAIDTMRHIAKKEILSDKFYRNLDMSEYLEEYGDNDHPFNNLDDWGAYVLEIR